MQIDRLAGSYFDAKLFNGSLLVEKRGEVILKKSYGFANLELKAPNNPKTKFRIGSITKQFTAALILQLREEGKLDLKEKIAHYLPWYRKETGDRVTVHHLLSHTSGIPNYTRRAAIREIINSAYTPRQVAEKYCSSDLEFEPGTRFSYNNSGYFLLGLIIEELTGKSYGRILQERIFRPLGMSDSGLERSVDLLPNRAAGYEFGFDGYENTEPIDMALTVYAAGAIYSTVEDMKKWQSALFGERLLSKESLAMMLKPGLGNYGYGVYITKSTPRGYGEPVTAIGHSGGINGFSALSIRYVEDDISITLLDNTRVGKRGNLENLGLGIATILRGGTPDRVKRSIQVEVTNAVKLGQSGKQIFFRFREKSEHLADSYDYEGAEVFLNDLGYRLLIDGKIEQSIGVLALAVEKFPNSANTFDTYAEALLKDGQLNAALASFKRSLELDPKNTNAADKIKKLSSSF